MQRKEIVLFKAHDGNIKFNVSMNGENLVIVNLTGRKHTKNAC